MKRNKYRIEETHVSTFTAFAYGATEEEALANFRAHKEKAQTDGGYTNLETTTRTEIVCYGEFLGILGNSGIACGDEVK